MDPREAPRRGIAQTGPDIQNVLHRHEAFGQLKVIGEFAETDWKVFLEVTDALIL